MAEVCNNEIDGWGSRDIKCKSNKEAAYFIINENGIEQVLNSVIAKQIFLAENMLHDQRKSVMKTTGLDMFLNDPLFDSNVLCQIHTFLPG